MTATAYVHRSLGLSSPSASGLDVHRLQQAVTADLEHRKFAWRAPQVDGELGRQTLHAAAFDGWLAGLEDELILEMKHGRKIHGKRRGHPFCSQEAQHLLRNPKERSKHDRHRESQRHAQAKRLREAHDTGPNMAIEWALQQVGTHEIPAGSNLGPGITEWEHNCGYSPPPGVFWCGCFVHQALVVVGGAIIVDSDFMGYGPTIEAYARAASHGIHAVPFHEIRLGDGLCYWNGEHQGVAIGSATGDSVPTCEGNTSSSGSESNGGCVETKTRSESDVTCAYRVDHWGR